jgi:uncharacterized membrane-anchored protein
MMADEQVSEVEKLKAQVQWYREHAEALDKNWERYVEFTIGFIRDTLDLDIEEPTVPEIAMAIRELQRKARQADGS